MKILKTETLFDGEYLKLKQKHYESKNGKTGAWEFIEHKISGEAVIIFALTKNKEVILEKIFRVPLEDWILELPAGLQDKKGELEIETARRELLEETGYKAEKMIPILRSPVNSATTTEQAVYYFAPDVELAKEKPLAKEDVEEIETVKIPIKELVNYIENQSKKMKVDIRILSILPILQKRGLIEC